MASKSKTYLWEELTENHINPCIQFLNPLTILQHTPTPPPGHLHQEEREGGVCVTGDCQWPHTSTDTEDLFNCPNHPGEQ